MLVVYYALVTLLCAKVAWNFAAPYVLLKRASSLPAGEEPPGMSMMLFVEWGLLLLAAATAALGHDSTPLPFGAFSTFWVGSAAVVVSYLHVYVVSGVVGRRER